MRSSILIFETDPRQRGWYKGQEKSPDRPIWSDIYIFNSNKALGITATQGYGLKGNTLGPKEDSGTTKVVFAGEVSKATQEAM